MGVLAYSREMMRVLGEFAQIVPVLAGKKPKKEDRASLGAIFEDSVARNPQSVMLLFEGRQWTYSEFNAEVNQLAHMLQARGIKRGDCVAVLMENRAEFVLALLALAKLGAPSSLINNSLSGKALVHCFKETGAKKCVVGAERTNSLAEIMPELLQSLSWNQVVTTSGCPMRVSIPMTFSARTGPKILLWQWRPCQKATCR